MRRHLVMAAVLIGGILGATPSWSESPAKEVKSNKINVNTADEATLAKLPGIGEKGAAAIIEYRTKNGPFKIIDDLKAVPGITDLTVERLGNRRLTVGEE
ncbi:MAG: ComEA family DNA-binding protein [Candidatus Binatia bacterium]